MNESPLDFGARVRIAREAKGLTLEQVAYRTGLSVKTIWVAEHGKAPTQRSTRRLIAEELGIAQEPDAEVAS